ncbi:T6SS phospholipase effector Tle1-like catalytic domain-containing protein [Mesorhizobium erdmanii]|nr:MULTISPECIES: DUF2235 domain-containing protein [Mesorhizobium]
MPRALIFLFDGTANEPTEPSAEPSNVFKLNSLVAESRSIGRRHRSQVTFYIPGIGTKFTSRGMFSKIRQLWFGDGVYEMVMRAYINLASNYRPGDDLLVIGFSRGAIAARLFCRLVSDFGLLQANSVRYFSDMFEGFSAATKGTFNSYAEAASKFRSQYSEQMLETPSIKFLGLFDCVGGPREFRNFLHVIDQRQSENVLRYVHLMSLHDMRDHFVLARLQPSNGESREIWVPGVHSDVGGGYRHDALANTCLFTMAIALQRDAGIALETTALSKLQDEIDTSLASHLVAVNREGPSVAKKKRNDYFLQSDKVHWIHFVLIGESVHWKDEAYEVYQNRLGDSLAPDDWTRKLLQKLGPFVAAELKRKSPPSRRSRSK